MSRRHPRRAADPHPPASSLGHCGDRRLFGLLLGCEAWCWWFRRGIRSGRDVTAASSAHCWQWHHRRRSAQKASANRAGALPHTSSAPTSACNSVHSVDSRFRMERHWSPHWRMGVRGLQCRARPPRSTRDLTERPGQQLFAWCDDPADGETIVFGKPPRLARPAGHGANRWWSDVRRPARPAERAKADWAAQASAQFSSPQALPAICEPGWHRRSACLTHRLARTPGQTMVGRNLQARRVYHSPGALIEPAVLPIGRAAAPGYALSQQTSMPQRHF